MQYLKKYAALNQKVKIIFIDYNTFQRKNQKDQRMGMAEK